jgi:hypothetical protein
MCWFANDDDFHTPIKDYKFSIVGVVSASQVRASILLSLPTVGKRKVRSRCGIQLQNIHINFHEDLNVSPSFLDFLKVTCTDFGVINIRNFIPFCIR